MILERDEKLHEDEKNDRINGYLLVIVLKQAIFTSISGFLTK